MAEGMSEEAEQLQAEVERLQDSGRSRESADIAVAKVLRGLQLKVKVQQEQLLSQAAQLQLHTQRAQEQMLESRRLGAATLKTQALIFVSLKT